MGLFSSIGKVFSSVVKPVTDVVGGVLGTVSGHNANKANAASNEAQLALAREQFEYQKELNRNQMQWRVEDAKKAGLHPMAAIGLQSSSFSPVSSSFTPMQGQDYSWISDMGQSAGYAAMKAKDARQQQEAVDLATKQSALQLQNMELQNQNLEIENEYKRWQLQTAMSGATGQALRSPGSASTRSSSGQPDARMPDKKGSVPAGDSMYSFQETYEPGVFTLQPGSDWAQLFEDKGMIPELWPLAKTYAVDLAHRFAGEEINGMVYSDSHGGWVKAGGPLDDTKSSWRSLRFYRDKFARFLARRKRVIEEYQRKYRDYKY